jgi:hypothetical protein
MILEGVLLNSVGEHAAPLEVESSRVTDTTARMLGSAAASAQRAALAVASAAAAARSEAEGSDGAIGEDQENPNLIP